MAQGKCCGVVEEAAAAVHEKRAKRTTPQAWAIRKFMVVVSFGIMGYVGYVYIGRLCVPMIKRKSNAGAGRSTGIALLVVFAVLYLWVIWAYIKAIVTSPGYAKDHVTLSDRPLIPANIPLNESWHSTSLIHNLDDDVELDVRDQLLSQPPPSSGTRLAGPSYEDLMRRDESFVGAGGVVGYNPALNALDSRSNPVTQKPSIIPPTSEPRPSDSFGLTLPPTAVVSPSPQGKTKLVFGHKLKLQKSKPVTSTASTTPAFRSDKRLKKTQRLQELLVERRPPTTPVLQPLHRYCQIEGFVKPYRAHHCRSCGTCVLKYDHHCPWIGQCVGARNHKFFINFCQATIVFTSYVFGTSLAFVIRINTANIFGSLDPQHVLIIALCGLFLIFTGTLEISHVRMILTGMTTVETMRLQSMEGREKRLLGKVYSWWEFGAKARKLREWDEIWGALSTEGNIWWRGDQHTEWIDVMGSWWLGWIFPVGRGLNDGLTYPVNPRFDGEGRWRKRVDWPEELR